VCSQTPFTLSSPLPPQYVGRAKIVVMLNEFDVITVYWEYKMLKPVFTRFIGLLHEVAPISRPTAI
jgi:hypothetical protein